MKTIFSCFQFELTALFARLVLCAVDRSFSKMCNDSFKLHTFQKVYQLQYFCSCCRIFFNVMIFWQLSSGKMPEYTNVFGGRNQLCTQYVFYKTKINGIFPSLCLMSVVVLPFLRWLLWI